MPSSTSSPSTEITRDEFWTVERTAIPPMLRITRSGTRFEREEDIESSSRLVLDAMSRFDRARYRLLVDLRDGPLRTDRAFEARFEKFRVEMLRGYARTAILVRSAVGKLQVQRHARADATPLQVFDDERAAMEFLAG
jgi:hypothetical protein